MGWLHACGARAARSLTAPTKPIFTPSRPGPQASATPVATQVIDNEPAQRIVRGIIGLQLHGGEPMTIEFRDILLKRLK